ncbi:hypothetical protein [Streptomyces sp. NPDC057686]|uniref:hypothetical protein n=1 Tax=Streptomyces sp. NPDC057686 TaxID=3346212 RepID=UPI00367B503E
MPTAVRPTGVHVQTGACRDRAYAHLRDPGHRAQRPALPLPTPGGAARVIGMA